MLIDPLTIFVAFILLTFLFILGVFIYRDATRTETPYPLLWGFLSFIGGLGGVAVYYFYQRSRQ
jgi:hypothetical protein